MKRRIDTEAEARALEELVENVDLSTLERARNGSYGARCEVLDKVARARRLARHGGCAEALGVSIRTLERWAGERQEMLKQLDLSAASSFCGELLRRKSSRRS